MSGDHVHEYLHAQHRARDSEEGRAEGRRHYGATPRGGATTGRRHHGKVRSGGRSEGEGSGPRALKGHEDGRVWRAEEGLHAGEDLRLAALDVHLDVQDRPA